MNLTGTVESLQSMNNIKHLSGFRPASYPVRKAKEMTNNNSSSTNDVIPEFLILMINGLSNHVKSANRMWLSLAIISILTISFTVNLKYPTDKTNQKQPEKTATISLPFQLGKVSTNDFYPFSASLLSILIISFGAAKSQSIRSQKLVNKVLREIKESITLPGGCDIRDCFDVIAVSSINRTVPLAQLLLGKYQFFPEKENQNIYLKIVAFFYQAVLKIVTYFVAYLLPGYALYIAFFNGKLFEKTTLFWGVPIFVLWSVSGVATIILIQLLFLELKYGVESIGNVFKTNE